MSTLTGDPVEPSTAAATGAEDAVDEAGTAPGDRRFRPDVEGLRAVAVLLVVLYHAGLRELTGGYVGVDVFFVISGFVITGLLLRERAGTGHTSLLRFYGRRVRRILPAATLVIVVTVVATYAVLGAYYGDPTAVAARWTAVFLANVHFAAGGTDYLAATLPPSPLQNFWSLAVEEQFYLVFPALVLVAASVARNVSLRIRLAVVLVPVIALSLWLSATQTASNPSAAFFSPFTRAWELALGALVAVATPALLRLPRAAGATLTWLGLAAIGWAAVAYSASTPYPGTAVIVPVVGTALVVAGGTPVPPAAAERILRTAPFQWFGRLSYSLYLWHWPILVLAAEHAGGLSLPFRDNLVWLALAVAVAYATHRLVENPVRHARVWTGRPWLPVAVGSALVATSLVVATVGLAVHGGAVGSGAPGPIVPLRTAAVERQVAAAVHITRLPQDLTPTLAGVRDDWGGPVQPCWPTYAQTTVATCAFGDLSSPRTVVLYGDSHAAMWFGDMVDIANLFRLRLVVLAKGDCPAVDLAFGDPSGYGSPDGTFTACDAWHRFALARIRELHPYAVVVTQNPDLGPAGREYSAAKWQAATAEMLQQLPVDRSRVVLLGNIPETVHGGPECLTRNIDDVQRCSGPNRPYYAAHAEAEQAAASEVGVGYIDTHPWFCSTTCTDVIGHYQPYWDPFHVTASYAQVVVPALATALVTQLTRPT